MTPSPSSVPVGHLGFWTGAGLVVANMIGAGVFLSAGFMVQDLGPAEILLSWVVGAAIALCGTEAYAALAAANASSGGEYRYLHDHLHPFVGHLAGWASLLVGFAAPVAVDAAAAGAFLQAVWPGVPPLEVATAIVVGLTAVHAVGHGPSKHAQNALVAVKLGAVLAFVALGLAVGERSWPSWRPLDDAPGFPAEAFVANQYWVFFAFSGWNAAVYAASEYRDPRRDVPRAMRAGCAAVAVLYLLCNLVFVANLAPERARVATELERSTLAHLVVEDLLGPGAAVVASLVLAWVLVSAASAMTLVGPRVTAAMAADGALPGWLGARPGRPPTAALLVQGAVALVLLHGRSLLATVQSASAVLMVFTALVAAVVVVRPPPGTWPAARLAAGAFSIAVGVLLVTGLATQPGLAATLLLILVLATAGWLAERRRRPSGGRRP